MRTLFASAFTLVAFTACAATDDTGIPTDAPAPAVASQAIINGSADTSTPAAVFVYADNFGCTGSLFKVDRQRDLAWVLTAAHCVQDQSGNPVVPNGVVITTDYNTDPNLIFMQAIRAEHDPRYDGSNGGDRYDVGVITLQGIPDDSVLPPLLPLTGASDGLSVGTPVTSYGFGTTNVAGTDSNSTRRTVSMTVAQLDAIDIVYNQATKGICSGDSGGPIVAGGKVVGIHSRVLGQSQQQKCNGTAYSVRVSAVLPFIDGVVANDVASPPAAVDSCDRCVRNSDYGDTVCRQKRDRCAANADCGKLLACLQEAGSSSSKQSACFTANPKAQGMLFDYYACSCNDLCTAECSTNTDCREWGKQKCGSIGLGDLASCVESTCCTEMDEAAADPVAFACLTGSSTAGCASNALFVAANACIEACDTGASSSSGGKASSGGASGTSGEAGEGEAEGDDDGTGGTRKKSNKDEGGCSVSAPGGLGGTSSAFGGLVLGLGLLGVRRRAVRSVRSARK